MSSASPDGRPWRRSFRRSVPSAGSTSRSSTAKTPRAAAGSPGRSPPSSVTRARTQGTARVAATVMVGPRDSVLGIDPKVIVARYLDHLPRRFEVATGVVQFNSVIVDVDEATGLARSIERVDREWTP